VLFSADHGHKKAADWQPKDEKPIGGAACRYSPHITASLALFGRTVEKQKAQ